MARGSLFATSVATLTPSRPFATSTVWSDYWALTKPDVNFLIALTTAAGFYLGASIAPSPRPWLPLAHTVVGTLLVASGAAVLNQWLEFPFDAMMRRTARRPIVAGRIEPNHALMFGLFLSQVGLVYLLLTADVLAPLLALLTLGSYLCVYTPLKRITPLCTLVGAIPGAMPPLIGWAAARGRLDPEAWLLFVIVFLWQFPHFMSIAWMYRDDYDRARYRVLPDPRLRGRFVAIQTLVPLVGLALVSVLLGRIGDPSASYSMTALTLGLGFAYFGVRFVRHPSGSSARRLLMASIVYLPALLSLIVLLP
jgi:heme o synthase